MFIEEIIVANGAAIVLLLILLYCQYMARRYSRTEDKVFSIFVYIGLACAIFELTSFLVDGQSGTFLRLFNITVNTLLYAGTATVSVFWVWYVELNLNKDVKKLKGLFFPLFIFWALLIGGLIGNIWGHYFFTVTPENVYEREPLGYIFYGYLAIAFIISIVEYVRFRINHGEAQFFPIWMFLAPVIIACVIQALWYGISITWLGCAIGLISIYLNIQSKRSLVDNLTGLYNRAYIEHKLIAARISSRYVYSGIMLDVDYFKQINDTYGHSVGDQALQDTAKILLSAVDRHCIPFRFAGDEFIILVKVPVSKANELEAKTLEIEDRVRKATEKFNAESEKPYKIVFSIGHTFYSSKVEDDTFFHNMDKEMYKEKQIHHKAHKE